MTGLEALQEFKGNNNTKLVGRAMGKQHYLDCLQAMEKSLKALEIIKKKNVNIKLLKASSTVEQYNNELIRVLGRWFAEREFLTLEEFNLLKEVLE